MCGISPRIKADRSGSVAIMLGVRANRVCLSRAWIKMPRVYQCFSVQRRIVFLNGSDVERCPHFTVTWLRLPWELSSSRASVPVTRFMRPQFIVSFNCSKKIQLQASKLNVDIEMTAAAKGGGYRVTRSFSQIHTTRFGRFITLVELIEHLSIEKAYTPMQNILLYSCLDTKYWYIYVACMFMHCLW